MLKNKLDESAWLTALVISHVEKAKPEMTYFWALYVVKGRKWLKMTCHENHSWRTGNNLIALDMKLKFFFKKPISSYQLKNKVKEFN